MVQEAVIVSAARSPIGRANKGSLVSMRPDDLAAQVIKAALDAVPEFSPADLEDLMLGCAQPAGESGFNMARVVAVLLGLDQLGGVTVNRFCASSLQTTRMAVHAIRAGEGDAFISAGVETVSRFGRGSANSWPDTQNPIFDEARSVSAERAGSGFDTWDDPRAGGGLPDVYIAMGQTAENVARLMDVSRVDMDHFAVRSQNRAEAALDSGFWAEEIVPVTLADGTAVVTDDCPRGVPPTKRWLASRPPSSPTAESQRANPVR